MAVINTHISYLKTRTNTWTRMHRFHYMAVSDVKQRLMPQPVDRQTGQVLDFPEAVLLTKPVDPVFKGEVIT